MDHYGARIAALARQAERDRTRLCESDSSDGKHDDVEPQPDDGASDPASAYLREGVGRAVWLYIEGRTGGRFVQFSPAEYGALEDAMNAWLECYAWCHGVDIDASFTLRAAAELLLETRNVHDVGQLLTGVP